MEKAIKVAAQIEQMASDTLAPLAKHMRILKWPAEYQAIVWGAVAEKALRLSEQK